MIEIFLMLIAVGGIINGTPGPPDAIQGIEGEAGCSGNPNPPSEIDVWKYEHREFTSRQDDIRIGTCYSSMNTALINGTGSEITISLVNGTQIALIVNSSGVYQK